MQQITNYSKQQIVIFNLCNTRWEENLDGYNQFLLAYPYKFERLEVISHKLHLKKYRNWCQLDTESEQNSICIACRYCNNLVLNCLDSSCQIIFLLGRSYQKDTRTKSGFIGRCGTGRRCSLRSCFHSKRRCQAVFFSLVWVRSGNGFPNRYGTKHAASYCSPTVPKKDVEPDTSLNCYKKNVSLPFLDHLINRTDVYFDNYGKIVLMM